MAYSQVQCLDDSHVNWRSNQSKPEFFYSEEQRLALEALVSQGPEAFYEVLKKENIRDFLSELELKKILETIETYDPGSEDLRGSGSPGGGGRGPEPEEEEAEPGGEVEDLVPSLEYWPQKSDRSIPQLDIGWLDTIAYRGVTRASVYMQPPIDGQAHIKEVARKMINQAQKVIAVVMDMFTDVDIFKDLLDAGFKRKVAVYIIVDEANVKYFLQMCERAQMHLGHLKNLRVRSIGGTEFFTRSATKFKGALAQKFMFVDGDRAMCGSYSFTWSAARTDRNVISVLSGQVVEMFDRQFQELYLMSRGVSLKSISMEKEPEPEPIVLPSVVPLAPSGTVAKKLINPKYALVKAKSADELAKAASSSEKQENGPTKRLNNKGKALPGNQLAGDLLEPPPPVHPGLLNMERANMFDYLPTWVEPDPEPGSDILGYINIIDPKVWNPQPSQMNRIKICDSSQVASTQHKQQLLQGPESQAQAPPSPSLEGSEAPPGPHSPCSSGRDKAEASASPVGSCSLRDGGTDHGEEQEEDARLKTPVPKPRTVHVSDFINQSKTLCFRAGGTSGQVPSNGHPKLHRQLSLAQEDGDPTAPGTPNGLDRAAELEEEGRRDGEEEDEEEEDDDYVTISDQDSFSGSSTHSRPRRSAASSVSDEYFEVRDRFSGLRRRHSDHVPNGTGHGQLRRKLSDPHLSRGTLGSPQWMQSLSIEDEFGRKRNCTIQEIKQMLGRGLPLNGNEACSSPAAQQGQQFYHYGDKRPPPGGRDKDSCQQLVRNPGLPKYRRDGAHPSDGHQQSAQKPSPAAAGQRYWQSQGYTGTKGRPPSRLSPDSGPLRAGKSQPPAESRTLDEMRTPFGIPYSKLSQTKYLKNKAGGGQWQSPDSRRRNHGPTSHKDL
ncbi:protein FAM83G [Tachyglossus aculeatus]|uniref:protein FAM83G n=1 Tax=Tachyglossus aculeatus TaxID=9261 RepID=UPI0018F3C4DF|nr:protein FAM83G [Tachyglossus aculeatus]